MKQWWRKQWRLKLPLHRHDRSDGMTDPQDLPAPQENSAIAESTGLSARARLIAALIFLVIAGLFIVVLARSTQGGDTRAASPLIGELVPAIEGELLLGASSGTDTGAGREPNSVFNIDAVTGRWVLVNFFASWCVPCRQEHPEIVSWSNSHPFDGQVVSIPFGDTDEAAVAFFTEYGDEWPGWPVVKDANADWATAFGVLRPPESFLVAPNGAVIAKWLGRITAAEIDQVIAAASGA